MSCSHGSISLFCLWCCGIIHPFYGSIRGRVFNRLGFECGFPWLLYWKQTYTVDWWDKLKSNSKLLCLWTFSNVDCFPHTYNMWNRRSSFGILGQNLYGRNLENYKWSELWLSIKSFSFTVFFQFRNKPWETLQIFIKEWQTELYLHYICSCLLYKIHFFLLL